MLAMRPKAARIQRDFAVIEGELRGQWPLYVAERPVTDVE